LGPSLCFLSAALQTLAVGLAFRLARSIRFRWGWVTIACAMGLQGVRRVSVGLELMRSGGPLPFSEWISFAISVLFLIGTIALQEFFVESQRDAAFRRAAEAQERAERERDQLRDRHQEVALEHRSTLKQTEELARFLETVVDTADVWINTLDMQARVVLWNHAAEQISGYGREEVLGRSEIWSWLYPDEAYRAEVAGKAAAILQRDEVVRDLETTIRTKGGGTRIIAWNSRTLRNDHGEITGSLAIGRDVTDFRETEQKLQRVHALQNLILEHNVLGMAYVQDRRIVWGNPRAAELFGVPLAEFIGAPARIIYPDDATYEDMGRKAYAVMAKGEVSDFRFQTRRRNGQAFWCRLVGLAVDSLRPHSGSVWLAEDITAQVEAESALSESEARFRGAFEGTQDALLLLTLDGVFDCNQRALELFGFTHKAEMLRLHPADLSPARQPGGEGSRGLAMKHLQGAIRDGSVHFEWQFRRQSGVLFSAEVLMSAFRMGRRKVIQACVRDITDRFTAEAKMRESEARFRMLFERYAEAALLLDSQANEFVDYNPAALEMLRCTREELNRFSLVDISPPFQPDGRSSFEQGNEMVDAAIRNGSHRFPWVLRSPHRGDFRVEVLLTAIQPGASPLVFATWREILTE
jgi:PAS domain S-box-containing protein